MNLYIVLDSASGALCRKCFCKDSDEAIALLKPVLHKELLFVLVANQPVPNSFLT